MATAPASRELARRAKREGRTCEPVAVEERRAAAVQAEGLPSCVGLGLRRRLHLPSGALVLVGRAVSGTAQRDGAEAAGAE